MIESVKAVQHMDRTRNFLKQKLREDYNLLLGRIWLYEEYGLVPRGATIEVSNVSYPDEDAIESAYALEDALERAGIENEKLLFAVFDRVGNEATAVVIPKKALPKQPSHIRLHEIEERAEKREGIVVDRFTWHGFYNRSFSVRTENGVVETHSSLLVYVGWLTRTVTENVSIEPTSTVVVREYGPGVLVSALSAVARASFDVCSNCRRVILSIRHVTYSGAKKAWIIDPLGDVKIRLRQAILGRLILRADNQSSRVISIIKLLDSIRSSVFDGDVVKDTDAWIAMNAVLNGALVSSGILTITNLALRVRVSKQLYNELRELSSKVFSAKFSFPESSAGSVTVSIVFGRGFKRFVIPVAPLANMRQVMLFNYTANNVAGVRVVDERGRSWILSIRGVGEFEASDPDGSLYELITRVVGTEVKGYKRGGILRIYYDVVKKLIEAGYAKYLSEVEYLMRKGANPVVLETLMLGLVRHAKSIVREGDGYVLVFDRSRSRMVMEIIDRLPLVSPMNPLIKKTDSQIIVVFRNPIHVAMLRKLIEPHGSKK